MTQYSLPFFRLLGAAHIVVAIALLPLNLFFGLFSLLIVMPGLMWLDAPGAKKKMSKG